MFFGKASNGHSTSGIPGANQSELFDTDDDASEITGIGSTELGASAGGHTMSHTLADALSWSHAIVALEASPAPPEQTLFYIDEATGDDGNLGTIGAPWASLAAIDTHKPFDPGDIICIKGGGNDYREVLFWDLDAGSGTAGNKIVIEGQCPGFSSVAPEISGANLKTSWGLVGGGEYSVTEAVEPSACYASSMLLTRGTVTSLDPQEWDWTSAAGGTLFARITGDADPDTVTFECSVREVLRLQRGFTSHVRLSNLVFKFGGKGSVHDVSHNSAWIGNGDGHELSNVSFQNMATHGLSLRSSGPNAKNYVFENVTINGYGHHRNGSTWAGVWWENIDAGAGEGFDHFALRSSTVANDEASSPTLYPGLYIQAGSPSIDEVEISGASDGILVDGSGGTTASGDAKSPIIRGSFIHDSVDDGIVLQGLTAAESVNTVIAYNHFRNNGGDDVDTHGSEHVGKIVHNIFETPEGAALLWSSANGAPVNPTGFFQNNVVYSAATYGLQAAGVSNLTSEGNAWYNAGTAPFSHPVNGDRTLTQWRADTGQDLESTTSDPLFVDLANRNFRLRAASPCRDAGVDVAGITTFVDNLHPDCGHIEYPAVPGLLGPR